MNSAESWYVVQQSDGHCEIQAAAAIATTGDPVLDQQAKWGPFTTQGEAIARRVGLIRAGKCKPA